MHLFRTQADAFPAVFVDLGSPIPIMDDFSLKSYIFELLTQAANPRCNVIASLDTVAKWPTVEHRRIRNAFAIESHKAYSGTKAVA